VDILVAFEIADAAFRRKQTVLDPTRSNPTTSGVHKHGGPEPEVVSLRGFDVAGAVFRLNSTVYDPTSSSRKVFGPF
jgi:hypothetical protein